MCVVSLVFTIGHSVLLTMYLLLVFALFVGPRVFRPRFTVGEDNSTEFNGHLPQTGRTLNITQGMKNSTELNEHLPQTGSTLNTTQGMNNSTERNRRLTQKTSLTLNTPRDMSTPGESEALTKTNKAFQNEGLAHTPRTDSFLNGNNVNQTSIPTNVSVDLQNVTGIQTTVSSKDTTQYASPDKLFNLESGQATPYAFNSQSVPQFEHPPSKTSLQPSHIANISSSPENVTLEDFRTVTSDDVWSCLLNEETIFSNTTSGQILFSHGGLNHSGNCVMEFVMPLHMVMQMFVFVNTTPCSSTCLQAQECRGYEFTFLDVTSNFLTAFSCFPKFQRVLSTGHRARLQLKTFSKPFSIQLSINFTAVPPPELQAVFFTPTTGYIQSPDWDGKINYPGQLNISRRLDIPSNYSVMLSFRAMDIERHRDCSFDRLTITIRNRQTDGESVKLIYCNKKPVLKPTVFHADQIMFNFVSNEHTEHLGFKLHFSFHNQSEIPEKLENGKWNCSVPYWSQFQLHFSCNKLDECLGKEDEDNCDYVLQKCDEDFIAVGPRCYQLISGDKLVTWNEAANECLQRESYLASLNSPEEMEQVIKVVMDIALDPVYVGLQVSGASLPHLYRDCFQWVDGNMVLYANVINRNKYGAAPRCSMLIRVRWYFTKRYLWVEECNANLTTTFLCEKNMRQIDSHVIDENHSNPQGMTLHPVQWQTKDRNYVTCPSGHVTLTMLACDPRTACWADQYNMLTPACQYPGKPPPPSLQCTSGVDSVPYTLVCDHRPDCSDNSDESFCVFPSCQASGMFQCSNKQCVPNNKRCDKTPHCLDGSDELYCPWSYLQNMFTPKPPAIIHFESKGSYQVKPLIVDRNERNSSNGFVCPETHFLCPGNLTYCMPVFVRCNSVYDCPGREDEDGCDSYQCPGFYRCRDSRICVHANHICDSVFQCPQHDDELLCEATCPENCSCQGLAFYCHGQFPAEQYPELRFLHAEESGMNPKKLALNSLLIYLNLAKCSLRHFDLVNLPNLRILDLSYNKLLSLKTSLLDNNNNLQKLSLAGNPLKSLFVSEHDSSFVFPYLETLDISHVHLLEFNAKLLEVFPKLTSLNLTACGLKRISEEGFTSLKYLRYLYMTGCPITEFPMGIFHNLGDLKEMWTDNYKLCCQVTLPQNFPHKKCHSPPEEISSCDALLRSDIYRIILIIFATVALIGNFGSFVYRLLINSESSNFGFGVFVTHLCVSDFLMGVYLAVIGVADQMYQGIYLWKDEEWRQSAGCKTAGFLSLLSSEVSAFLICLITLDRFIVLRFPFSSVHFKKKSAHVACLVAWLIGAVIAGIPLLPVVEYWEFYSQNGICIPLPITRHHSDDFVGHMYSFSVIVVVNFILFLLIAAGQMFIYWSVRTNRMSAGDSNKKNNDIVIARRLITIAMSDFLCWFPIGLLGLMASSGMSVPGEVNVAMAIVALPINSAINPFLYTINSLMEKRKKASEQRIKTRIMSAFAGKYTESVADRVGDNYTQGEALRLIRKWLLHNLVSPQKIEKAVLDAQNKSRNGI